MKVIRTKIKQNENIESEKNVPIENKEEQVEKIESTPTQKIEEILNVANEDVTKSKPNVEDVIDDMVEIVYKLSKEISQLEEKINFIKSSNNEELDTTIIVGRSCFLKKEYCDLFKEMYKQEYIAKKCCVSQGMISYILTGNYACSEQLATSFLEALGIKENVRKYFDVDYERRY